MTKKQRKQKQILEDKIDTLIDISEVTKYDPLQKEIAQLLNTYNFLYRTKFGEVYKIR